MPSLPSFPDFVQATGELAVKEPRGLINDATKNTYYVSRYFNGKSNRQLRQGGQLLRTEHMFTTAGGGASTAEFYSPGDARAYTNPQVLTKGWAYWRFLWDDMTWEEEELLFNEGGDMKQQFVDMSFKLEARVITSLINKMEEAHWAAPSEADMEASGGKRPYSVPCFINMGSVQTSANYQSSTESTLATYNNGFFDPGTASGTGDAWSTKANIDASAASVDGRWQAAFRTYTDNTVANINTENHLLAALDDMYLDVMFVRPPSFQAYFENQTMYGQHVCTSKAGINQYKRMLRASNDTLAMGHQDSGYNNPTIYGIDMLYISELNNAAVYLHDTDGSGLVTESDANAELSGAAYYFIDSNYYFPVFHSKRFMERKKPMNDRSRPTTWSVPVLNAYNHIPCSLRRMGLVKGDL